MAKITGKETRNDLPPKVLNLYEAIGCCIYQDMDVLALPVSDIAKKAGIGKGTVYEYFETKEEMIIYALIFIATEMFRSVEEIIANIENFEEQLQFLLTAIEQQTETRNYVLKYINLLFGSTQVGEHLKEKIGFCNPGDSEPVALMQKLLLDGIERKKIRNDLPIQYMIYVVMAKIVGYMIYLDHPSEATIENEQFKKLIIVGIVEELKIR